MIKHHFVKEKEALELFKNTENFNQFKSKLKKLSKSLPKKLPLKYGRLDDDKNRNKILGDGFELFCELLVKILGPHPHIGLSYYEPLKKSDKDEGVDAYALNLESEKSAVQCKFVSDATYEFTANGSNLSNFLNEAYFEDVEYKRQKIKRLYLITTAKDLHYHTKEKWRDSVWVINNKTIKYLTNNVLFWKICTDLIKESSNA